MLLLSMDVNWPEVVRPKCWLMSTFGSVKLLSGLSVQVDLYGGFNLVEIT